MRTEQKQGYVELFIDSYDEFIELIRPDRSNLNDYLDNSAKLLFRGQQDSEWELVPSLYRNNQRFNSYLDNFHSYYFAQICRLKSFVRACDRNLVPIPSDSRKFRTRVLFNEALIDKIVKKSEYAPPKDMYELLALAQHYGLSTELLDWTESSLIACLFMSTGVIKAQQIHGNMSLWVFDADKKTY